MRISDWSSDVCSSDLFDTTVDAAMARLSDAGAAVLNQAVLLRGVNDSVAALADLSERGFAAGVLPYYLHQIDRVDGPAHFDVPDARATELHAERAAGSERRRAATEGGRQGSCGCAP